MVSIRRLILSHTMEQVIPNICTKFQNPRCSCSWEIFDTNFAMYYIGVRDGKRQKWKKKAKINPSILIFFPPIYLVTLKVSTKFEDWLSWEPRNLWQKFLLERKKNGHIMRLIIRRRLILSYIIQEVIPNICTKFQNPSFSSSWEIFDEKKSLHTNAPPPPPSSLTHTHKHCYWKDKHYTPPMYLVYRGYNKHFLA